MPSVETKIWLALRARAEGLAALTGLMISWPNENFSAPAAGYLRVRHVPNVPSDYSLTAERSYRQGILQVMLHAKLNQNAAVSVELAGKIAAHFPPGQRMTYDDVIVRVSRTPSVGEPVPQESYAETAVNIQYSCFA